MFSPHTKRGVEPSCESHRWRECKGSESRPSTNRRARVEQFIRRHTVKHHQVLGTGVETTGNRSAGGTSMPEFRANV